MARNFIIPGHPISVEMREAANTAFVDFKVDPGTLLPAANEVRPLDDWYKQKIHKLTEDDVKETERLLGSEKSRPFPLEPTPLGMVAAAPQSAIVIGPQDETVPVDPK